MNCTQRKQLTDLQKGEILVLNKENQSQRKIAKTLKIPRPTIEDFLQQFKNRGTHENLHRPDRPHVTTEDQDQELCNAAMSQPRIAYNTLRERLNPNVSTRTLQRRLRKEFIRIWKARGCAKLTQRVANERFQWAMEYKDFPTGDWSRVVFTDEVSVEKGKDVTDVWIFRRLGERDKCLPEHVKPRVRSTVPLML